MKKMMFLTLALSVMVIGSAVANDSMSNSTKRPSKVKIEVNYHCDGKHDPHVKHNGHPCRSVVVHGCPICDKMHKPHRSPNNRYRPVPGMRPHKPAHNPHGDRIRPHNDPRDGYSDSK